MKTITPKTDLETIVLQWKGPYTLREINQLDDGNGVYLLTGHNKHSRSLLSFTKVLYCGITERRFAQRVNEKHHQVPNLKPDSLRVWLGCPIFPIGHDRSHLELLETCLVSFWQPELNQKKRAYYPVRPICLVVKWCKPDGTSYKRLPGDIAALKDVLWWDCKDWRSGNLKVEKQA
jgi:hypothetical protein